MSLRSIWGLGAASTLVLGTGCAPLIGLEPADEGPVFEKVWSFDSDPGPWVITDSEGPDGGPVVLSPEENLTVGYPDPGSVELTIPFTGPQQIVEMGIDAVMALDGHALDLTGKTLVAYIRIDQGIDTTRPSKAEIHLGSGPQLSPCESQSVRLSSPLQWSQMRIEGKGFQPGTYVDCDPLFDIHDITFIGIRVETVADAMPVVTTPTIVHIDTVGYY